LGAKRRTSEDAAINVEGRNLPLALVGTPDEFGPHEVFLDINLLVRQLVFLKKAFGLTAVRTPTRGVNADVHAIADFRLMIAD